MFSNSPNKILLLVDSADSPETEKNQNKSQDLFLRIKYWNMERKNKDNIMWLNNVLEHECNMGISESR